MLVLRWNNTKDVFFLSTIHGPHEAPNWVETGTAADLEEEEDPDEVRGVNVIGQW